MRKILTVLLFMAGLVSWSHAQQGVPAKMSIVGRGSADVFLQRVDLENGRLIFRLNGSNNDNAGPLDMISYLQFVVKLDGAEIKALYAEAKYQRLIDSIDRDLKDATNAYWPFMSIDNNFKNVFLMLMESCYRDGQKERATDAAKAFINSGVERLQDKGRSVLLRVALDNEDMERAESILEEVVSPAAKLYLTACIQQAKGDYKASIWSISDLLEQYSNDLDWVPMAELLNAKSYWMWAGGDVEPYMDSAIFTARQTQSIHTDTASGSEAGDLRQQWIIEKEEAVAAQRAREEANQETLDAFDAAAEASASSEEESVEEEATQPE